jgi:hypothetical protein
MSATFPGVPAAVLRQLELSKTAVLSKFGHTEDELLKINSFASESERKVNISVECTERSETKQQSRAVITPVSNSSKIYSPVNVYSNSYSSYKNNNSSNSFTNTNRSSPQFGESSFIHRGKKDIKVIHKIFYKCSKLVNDEFWNNILINCSINKFKKGFSYRDNYLLYRDKDKIYIDVDNPSTALKQIQNFMKKNAGIMSECDRVSENLQNVQRMKDNICEAVWSGLDQNYRVILLERYIQKLCDYYNLNDFESLHLKNVIYTIYVCGGLTDSNVLITSHKIVQIIGLCYHESSRNFTIEVIGKKNTRSNGRSAHRETSENKFVINKGLNELLKMLERKHKTEFSEAIVNTQNTSTHISASASASSEIATN